MAWVGIALVAMAWRAGADDHPSMARGFDPTGVFQIGEIDHVNLFNGNLVIALPIGQRYPVNGDLDYGLTLSYNASVWDILSKDDHPPEDPNTTRPTAMAVPSGRFNTGLGWTLSLGRLYAPVADDPDQPSQHSLNPSGQWIYVGPDGGEHKFFGTLHDSDDDEEPDPDEASLHRVSYTRDGSYLRLRRVGVTRELDFPNGHVHVFDAGGNLTEMRDRRGNSVQIQSVPNGYEIIDPHRKQKVFFKPAATIGAGQVDRVELTTFGSTTAATYRFHYAAVSLDRPAKHHYCGNTSGDASCPGDAPVPATVLSSIELPDGSLFTMTYFVNDDAGGSTGSIRDMVIPTGATLAWKYGVYRQIALDFEDDEGNFIDPVRSWSMGVVERTISVPGEPVATWTYDQSARSTNTTTKQQHTVTSVINPRGDKTLHYFNTWYEDWDYGLPYTRMTRDGADGPFLSQQIFEQTAANTFALRREVFVRYDADTGGQNFLLASLRDFNQRRAFERTVYRDDGNRFAQVSHGNFDGLGNYRSSTTGGNFGTADVRTTVRQLNTAAGRYDFDVETQTFRPGHGFTMLDETTPWLLDRPDFVSTSEGALPTPATKTSYCWDTTTGFLLRERRHRHPDAAHGNDIVVAYTASGQGNVASEEYHGADVRPDGQDQPGLGTGSLCDVSLPAPHYRIEHTYAGGALASTLTVGAGFKTVDHDIEPRTGRVRTSRDASGLPTGYEYDTLGRLTWIKPGEGLSTAPAGATRGAWTEYQFAPGGPACARSNPTACAQVKVFLHSSGSKSPATVLKRRELYFDGLGRLWRERESTGPGNQFNVRDTAYDAMGWKTSVSELGPSSSPASAPTAATLYQDYDSFGRPRRIVPPEGGAAGHDVTMSYSGVRSISRTERRWVRPSASAEPVLRDVVTTERYDRQGRLDQVLENVTGAPPNVVAERTTTYGYDVAGRLEQVRIHSASGTQTRSFDYDALGFLRSEDMPEKGTSPVSIGNVQHDVHYGNYDALGNLGRRVENDHDLRFLYDVAGRLSSVAEQTSGRTLKTFTYGNAASNQPGNWNNGKLVRAARFNYPRKENPAPGEDPLHTVEIFYDYRYGARDGRLSSRALRVNFNGAPGAESFAQSFGYDQLGDVESLDYPQCTFPQCTGTEAQVFSDVGLAEPQRQFIEALFHAGLTGGCSVSGTTRQYCPNATVTRAQVAVFLVQGMEGTGYVPPACKIPMFTDVPCSRGDAPWINEIARRKITGGCAAGTFCPDNAVTRAQLAVMLLSAHDGEGFVPPACTSPMFGDIPCGHWAAPWVNEAVRRNYLGGCGGGNFCPDTAVTRRAIAAPLVTAFSLPVHENPSSPRRLALERVDGRLVDVRGFATLAYHPNGMLASIRHLNPATGQQAAEWTQQVQRDRQRPSSIAVATATGGSFVLGPFGYDGAGSVISVKDERYDYDALGRIARGQHGSGEWQRYTYDGFDNVVAITQFVGGAQTARNQPADPSTNRLSGAGLLGPQYDLAGSLVGHTGTTYEYDALGQMTRLTTPNRAQDWIFAYDADGERVWEFDARPGVTRFDRWTVRDLAGRPLRVYEGKDFVEWSLVDYVHGPNGVLASHRPVTALETLVDGRKQFHLDHLGTPRAITNGAGVALATHHYFPYGEEVFAPGDSERIKFTGHERDLLDPSSPADDLDYMHARHYRPLHARFMSIDPAAGRVEEPRSWNRYTYVLGDPLSLIDPDGRETQPGSGKQLLQGVLDYRFYENTTVVGVSGSAIVGVGVGGSVGIAIGPDLSDIGVYGTFSTGSGLDVSASVKGGTIAGDIQNVDGTHNALTAHFGEASASIIHHEGDTSHVAGAAVEAGPGLGRWTVTTERTGLITAREVAAAVNSAATATTQFLQRFARCFGPNAPHCWAHTPEVRGPQTATTPADPPPTGHE